MSGREPRSTNIRQIALPARPGRAGAPNSASAMALRARTWPLSLSTCAGASTSRSSTSSRPGETRGADVLRPNVRYPARRCR